MLSSFWSIQRAEKQLNVDLLGSKGLIGVLAIKSGGSEYQRDIKYRDGMNSPHAGRAIAYTASCTMNVGELLGFWAGKQNLPQYFAQILRF